VETELRRALRRLKPERRQGRLARRPDAELPFVGGIAAPRVLLLDTTVYVDGLEGTLPPDVDDLLETRTLIHHVVVLGELSHLFGRLDPGRPGTARALDELEGVIAEIPAHRTETTASARTAIEAGILAGLVLRLGGTSAGGEVAAMNDALLYLHAVERGYTVLTRNIRDFDLMDQLLPEGRVLFYRRG
jgi:predicted nucleic acid-binding protein